MTDLTEERLAEIEEWAGKGRLHPLPWLLELVAEVRRLQNECEDARGLAREYLYALTLLLPEAERQTAREEEAELRPWLLKGEATTATGVAESIFGQ